MEINYSGAADLGSPPFEPGTTLPPGTLLSGRFQVEAPLGQGGLGFLYRALDTKAQKPVAIRVLAPDVAQHEQILEGLRAQIKSASALQHKNICSVYGMGKEGSSRFIAMEFVEGQSLRRLLEKKRETGRTFSLKGTYNVLAHVCNALQHAHATVVHGLPGPGSILINSVGRVKVSEFGIVSALLPLSSPVARLGDRYCLSPEMETDPTHATPAADMYSLGVLLFELLTGRPPENPFIPASRFILGLPPEIDELLARCLHADPQQRLAEPLQLKAAFYAAIQGASEQAEVEGVYQQPGAPSSPQAPEQQSPMAPGTQPMSPPQPMSPQQAVYPSAQPGGPAHPAQSAPAQKQLTMQEIMARAAEDSSERWLVHKDRLDFGPFPLVELMNQLLKGQFSADDMVLDQDTGERTRIRVHPLFRDFSLLLDKHLEAEQMVKAEQEQYTKDKRRRTMLIAIVAGSLMVLGAGGAITAYYLTREPETRERIIYREKAGQDMNALIKGLEITWKEEPKEQALRRKKIRRKRPAGKTAPGGSGDVTHLGDATEEGGDAMLSQQVIQQVMASNVKRLAPCLYAEVRRTPTLRQVNIDFSVRGNGKVSFASVNGASSGPFQSCMYKKMQQLKFPSFDGSITRASFSLSLK